MSFYQIHRQDNDRRRLHHPRWNRHDLRGDGRFRLLRGWIRRHRSQTPRHLRDRRHLQLHRRLGRPRRRGEKTRFRQARCVYFNSRIRYTGNQFDVVFCQQISTWSTALSTSASWLSARPIPAWTCTTTRTAPTSRSTASTTSRSTAPSSWTLTPASPWKRISTQNSTRPSRR